MIIWAVFLYLRPSVPLAEEEEEALLPTPLPLLEEECTAPPVEEDGFVEGEDTRGCPLPWSREGRRT